MAAIEESKITVGRGLATSHLKIAQENFTSEYNILFLPSVRWRYIFRPVYRNIVFCWYDELIMSTVVGYL